ETAQKRSDEIERLRVNQNGALTGAGVALQDCRDGAGVTIEFAVSESRPLGFTVYEKSEGPAPRLMSRPPARDLDDGFRTRGHHCTKVVPGVARRGVATSRRRQHRRSVGRTLSLIFLVFPGGTILTSGQRRNQAHFAGCTIASRNRSACDGIACNSL